jgi:hypothetical protein
LRRKISVESEYVSCHPLLPDLHVTAFLPDLKLTAAIEHIHHLALGLVGDTMAVDFAGRRHRKYANVPPYDIKVQGTLRLSAESQPGH